MQKLKAIYARASAWAFPILIVIVLLSLKECKSKGEQVEYLSISLDSAARQARTFENDRGQMVSENRNLQAESSKKLEALTDSIFALKKQDKKHLATIQQYGRIIQHGDFIGKHAQWVDTSKAAELAETAPEATATPDTGTIQVPRAFRYADASIAFNGRVMHSGVILDSIQVENTLHFRMVEKKTGFLNLGRETIIQAINSNPGITNIGVMSISVPHRNNWWNRWGKPVAAALLAGAAVDHFKK